MSDRDRRDDEELEAFLQTVRDSRDEASRRGLVSPDEVERSAEEAIARGLEQRSSDRNASRRVLRR